MPHPTPPLHAPAPPPDIARQVESVLQEDLGRGDLSAALVAPETRSEASVVCREDAILCGTPWFDEVFRQLSPAVEIEWALADTDPLRPDQVLCRLSGPARALLSGERAALNLLQTLSGTATAAHRYSQALQGTGCQLLDTRKTLPGLRSAQKYATRCGGCRNHRRGLDDGILIKENHIAACGSIGRAVAAARRSAPLLTRIEVEVEDMDQVAEAIQAGADMLLLDNFTIPELRRAAARCSGHTHTEASGNITLDNIRAIAETGVDFISVGAVTKHLHATDFSMRFR